MPADTTPGCSAMSTVGDEATVDAAARGIVRTAAHYTSQELTELLLGKPGPHQLARMRDQRSLFGYRVARIGYLYPAFQFDSARRRLDPRVARINQLLLTHLCGNEAMVWWFAEDQGRPAPADVLQSAGSEPVLALAMEFLRSKRN